jgi:hypothetical protein
VWTCSSRASSKQPRPRSRSHADLAGVAPQPLCEHNIGHASQNPPTTCALRFEWITQSGVTFADPVIPNSSPRPSTRLGVARMRLKPKRHMRWSSRRSAQPQLRVNNRNGLRHLAALWKAGLVAATALPVRAGVPSVPEYIVIDPTKGLLDVVIAGNSTIVRISPTTGAFQWYGVLDRSAAGALFGLAAATQMVGSNSKTVLFHIDDNFNRLMNPTINDRLKIRHYRKGTRVSNVGVWPEVARHSAPRTTLNGATRTFEVLIVNPYSFVVLCDVRIG